MQALELASCPKCGTHRRHEPACPKCGLARARMSAYAQSQDATIPEVLTAAWDRTLQSWTVPAYHDELLRLVSQHDAYAWAASRYRTRADDVIGAEQLQRIRKAAEVTLFASAAVRAAKTPTPYRAVVAVLIMLVIAVIAGLLYAKLVSDKPTQGAAPPSEKFKPPRRLGQ